MGMSGGSGPDMAKMLQMMMPYMDPSTKRMMSIMMKLQELKVLMEPVERQSENKAAQPQKAEKDQSEGKSSEGAWEAEPSLRSMDDMNRTGQKADLAATLQEGLTPEQRNMITSLTGMLR